VRATIASRWCARRAAPARTPPLHSLLPLFTSPLSLSSIPCFPASPSCAISLLRCHIQSDISSSRVFFPRSYSPLYARLHMLASICSAPCLLPYAVLSACSPQRGLPFLVRSAASSPRPPLSSTPPAVLPIPATIAARRRRCGAAQGRMRCHALECTLIRLSDGPM
jgi:hypothetical protein